MPRSRRGKPRRCRTGRTRTGLAVFDSSLVRHARGGRVLVRRGHAARSWTIGPGPRPSTPVVERLPPTEGRRMSFAPFTSRRSSRSSRAARLGRFVPVEVLEERRLLANPVANAGGPYTMTEGQTTLLTLNGSATDADGDRINTYAWFLNGDNIADISGSNPRPTVSYALLRSLGIGDGPRTQTISLRVTDARGSQS